MEFVDVDYRIGWDGADEYRPTFQIRARTEDGSEKGGFTSDQAFNDKDLAAQFAKGLSLE